MNLYSSLNFSVNFRWLQTDLREDNLRGEVLRRAAQGPRPALHTLGETEVCDLQGGNIH